MHINMNNKKITNLANGILPNDAVTMSQLNNVKNISSNLNMNQHKITNLLDGTDNHRCCKSISNENSNKSNFFIWRT